MTPYDFRWVKSTSASIFWGLSDLNISIYSGSVTSQRETTTLWPISITWVHSGRQSNKGFSYISFVATQQCTVQINILCLKEFCIMSIFSLNHSFSCRIKPSNWWLPALSVESWCKSWVPDSLTSRDHSRFEFTILALKPNQSLDNCQKPIFKFWDIRKV